MRCAVSITGEHGIGKSAVAIAALNYLAERHYFSDGVLYIDASSVRSVFELSRIMHSHTALYSTPSISSPQLPTDVQASELQARLASLCIISIRCE